MLWGCYKCFRLAKWSHYLILIHLFLFFSFLGDLVFFLKDFVYLFLERVEGKEEERERNINVWLPLMCPKLGTWPATQECSLTRNWTGDPLVCRPALNPLSYTSQGQIQLFLDRKYYVRFDVRVANDSRSSKRGLNRRRQNPSSRELSSSILRTEERSEFILFVEMNMGIWLTSRAVQTGNQNYVTAVV